ncbi:MAG TPA: DUF1080 domain-containing protein [Candidatus Hydrogenedentes bacterium]|nr:DUF1080 domain-containing protein [Candidatus Hydrogenedentota bacterium]
MRTGQRMMVMALLAGFVTVSAFAQTVAEGQWINLFDKESTFGWLQFGDAQWKVANGELTATEGTGGWLVTTTQFADFEVAAKIKVTNEGTMTFTVRAALDGHPSETGAGALTIPAGEAVWHEIAVKAVGADVTATLDGKAVEGFGASAKRGHIGISFDCYHGDKGRKTEVAISEVKLRPLNLTSIFNGKDLTGWNILPKHKSVFSVVDGSMNIKNGNGQIETAGTYKDFVLQLDIMANGTLEKPLNSGVFFRGPVGVFWKGYESQVRNEFSDGDRSKPVDFGTGGLYGVQGARKVVPEEKKWFQKTVICEGNHIAVWVDGYQVTDYFDTRPVSPEDDGKNGFVPGPGTIHLQGHDPTTDMFFKNINLQEYGK